MKAYKVLLHHESRLYSVMAQNYLPFGEISNYVLEYQQDIEVKPIIENSKLFVFQDLASATIFYDRLDWDRYGWEIWECEIPDKEYESLKKVRTSSGYLLSVPQGTILVDSVIIRNKIW